MSYPNQKKPVGMDTRAAALYNRHRHTLPPLDGYPLQMKRFTAGERLAAVGEPLERLCFVVEGCATVHSLMPNGRAALLMEYRGVQTIGELELLTGVPVYSSEVRAVSRGAMLTIALPQSAAQLLADPAVLLYLGGEVARKLDRSSRLAAQDRLYPLAARLAAYLLYAQRGQQGTLNLTRVSELMGASYRHLLRTLHTFVLRGWIVRDGEAGYQIVNSDALAQLGRDIRYD